MLEQIPTASQIREMSEEELRTLSSDIREFLVEKTAEKGGHLASNLGMVELTLALVSAFDLPQDKIIFDVGH